MNDLARLARRAAENNALWCAAMWRAHGLVPKVLRNMTFCEGEAPRFYPQAVTVAPTADADEDMAFVADLMAQKPIGGFSIKDSFADLDLGTVGLRLLFEARWLAGPAGALKLPMDNGLHWERVQTADVLAAWREAWDSVNGAEIFVPALLEDAAVELIAGYDGSQIVAGAALYHEAGVVGVSNVFGSAKDVWGRVAALYPDRILVGYEQGEALEAAVALGLAEVGGLRVWVGE